MNFLFTCLEGNKVYQVLVKVYWRAMTKNEKQNEVTAWSYMLRFEFKKELVISYK